MLSMKNQYTYRTSWRHFQQFPNEGDIKFNSPICAYRKMTSRPCVKEALLYQQTDDRIICCTCERLCNISFGRVGFCRTRKNLKRRQYTLEYGDIFSVSANPIEKKLFFHFHPGCRALIVGSWGCNYICPWCQNYNISQSPPDTQKSNYVNPEILLTLWI